VSRLRTLASWFPRKSCARFADRAEENQERRLT
jgi:hypothetical protein